MITLDETTARRYQSVDQEIISLLDRLCKDLEITPAVFALAKERYESIAAYLNEPDSPLLKFRPAVYPQGSINLGTTVKPIGSDEFDVDVISQLNVSERTPTTAFKKLIFERLRKRGIYKLRMMNRCIRVQYANEFHIDITPAIPDRDQGPENILVTDKEAGCWKESNPKDYKTWFEEIAVLQPSLLYENRELTTLAAQSYKHHSTSDEFSNQVQFIRAVVGAMPEFIVRTNGVGAVPNPANPLENYADKWAAKPERQKAFYTWHGRVVTHFDKILDSLDRGKDVLFEELSNAYGKDRVKKAVIDEAEQRKILFEQHKLGITKRSGFTAPIEKAAKIGGSVMSVPKHTNFGE